MSEESFQTAGQAPGQQVAVVGQAHCPCNRRHHCKASRPVPKKLVFLFFWSGCTLRTLSHSSNLCHTVQRRRRAGLSSAKPQRLSLRGSAVAKSSGAVSVNRACSVIRVVLNSSESSSQAACRRTRPLASPRASTKLPRRAPASGSVRRSTPLWDRLPVASPTCVRSRAVSSGLRLSADSWQA